MTAQLLSAGDEDDALEELHRLGCTDGLPVLVPTADRVERMLLGTHLLPELELGAVEPRRGAATVEAVAVCAVMAGCLPEHLPVVLAAVEALCDPELDLGEVQQTTHSLGPTIVVNGPARTDCGPFESGVGGLGPGARANVSVGRAVRLCMINLGGGQPGLVDLATGQPGKLSSCIAEAEEASPFAPLHVRRGLSAGQSAVTVLNTEAPHSVLALLSDDPAESADRMVGQFAAAAGSPASNNINALRGQVLVLMNPEHAGFLARQGYDADSLVVAIAERTAVPRRRAAAWPPRSENDPDELVALRPEQLLLAVGGGTGAYSQVFPSWGYGAHGNIAVTKEVPLGATCELPTTTTRRDDQ